jgi:hypothetical protein
MNEYPYYAVRTFGTPGRGVPLQYYYRSLTRARDAAAACPGTGSCTTARVLGCATRWQAERASISDDLPVVATY